MIINKKYFWIVFFLVFISAGLLLEYYINIYKRAIDLKSESEKFEIAEFKINVFYDINFDKRFLLIEDQGINIFLHSTLRELLKRNIENYNINNIEIKITDQIIVNEDNKIIVDDFIYAENNMDNKLLLRITFLSTFSEIEKSLDDLDSVYSSFKKYFSKQFDADYRKKVIAFYENSFSKFKELFQHIKTFQPATPLNLTIKSSTELDILYLFLSNLDPDETELFLKKTNVVLDFEQQSREKSENDTVALPFDKILTSSRVGNITKLNYRDDLFGKNTFPLITLFFLIIAIAIYLFSKVIKYK